jgi:hypothetical protein
MSNEAYNTATWILLAGSALGLIVVGFYAVWREHHPRRPKRQ